MRRKYFTITIVILITAIIAVVAMFYKATMNTEIQKKRVDFIVKSTSTSFDFWQIVMSGAQEGAHEFSLDIKFRGPSNEENLSEQLSLIDQSIAENPDALIIAAIDVNAVMPYVEKAEKKGIKVLWVDSGRSDDGRCFVGTDNIAASHFLAQKMADSLGGRGKIAILSHSMNTSTAQDRLRGFKAVMDLYPDIKIVDTVDTGDSSDRTRVKAEEILHKYPDLDGFFATNAITSIGVSSAIAKLNRSGYVKNFAFDAMIPQTEAMEKGILNGTIVQQAFNMGYLGVKMAVEKINNHHVEDAVYTGFTYVDSTNLKEEQIQKQIYPFLSK